VLAALWVSEGKRRWLRAAWLLLFVPGFVRSNAGLWSAEDGAERSFRQFGIPNFAQAGKAADALQAHTEEGSKILVWGSEAEIYFLSRRAPASRFLFHYPFSGEAPAWPGQEEEWLQAMEAPTTSAVLLAQGLERQDPFQKKMGILLQKNYSLRADLAPGMLIGLRKR
jgi:hypothetical protein